MPERRQLAAEQQALHMEREGISKYTGTPYVAVGGIATMTPLPAGSICMFHGLWDAQ